MKFRILPQPVLIFSVLLVGCGAVPSESNFESDLSPNRSPKASYQHYLVLTQDSRAMQTASDVDDMWSAVRGELPEYAFVQPFLRRAQPPLDYEVDIELDYASLPHRLIPKALLPSLLKRLPNPERRRAEGATLAVSVQSNTKVIAHGAHIRLVGVAALRIADRHNGVIIDLMTDRAYTARQWRRVLESGGLQRSQLRFGKRLNPSGSIDLFSRGSPKYGAPDLVLNFVPPSKMKEASVRFKQLHQALMKGSYTTDGSIVLGDDRIETTNCTTRKHPCKRVSYPQRAD